MQSSQSKIEVTSVKSRMILKPHVEITLNHVFLLM